MQSSRFATRCCQCAKNGPSVLRWGVSAHLMCAAPVVQVAPRPQKTPMADLTAASRKIDAFSASHESFLLSRVCAGRVVCARSEKVGDVCRPARDGGNVDLSPGITHLWTTPVAQHQLIDAGGPHSSLLQAMETAVLRKFRAFREEVKDELGDIKASDPVNEYFYTMQLIAFQLGEPSFLEAEGSAGEIEAFKILRRAWLENARAYLANLTSDAAASVVFDDESLRMFVWVSVHEGSSKHVPHDHADTVVSGVFYVTTPPNAGLISFHDPRSARYPFTVNRVDHSPSAGELLIFPPWLVHSVGSSTAARAPRISISFNIFRTEGDDVDGQFVDGKELAETSAYQRWLGKGICD